MRDLSLSTKEPYLLLIYSLHQVVQEVKSTVFLELRKTLIAQDTEVLKSVPEETKSLAAALLNRATSIALSQKDLGLVRDEDCNNANAALNEASHAVLQANAILRPLEELNRKEQELVRQNKELKKELQELVRVHNNLQKNFESLSEAYAIMSQSFMTKGEEEMPQKGRGRKRKQSNPPSSSQLVIRDNTGDTLAEETVLE